MPELQSTVWADEVAVAAQKLEMFFECFCRASMGERPPRQIGRALSDGQIHSFDERRVQARRVLGVGERLSESPRRACEQFTDMTVAGFDHGKAVFTLVA